MIFDKQQIQTGDMQEFEMSIGLEVHVQLATATKMFCACRNETGRPPNTLVCPVCLGLPGALPVANHKALELAIYGALALHCEVTTRAQFDRKNYFYPDLPKGYQISQSYLPLARNGYIVIDTPQGEKKISVERLHMEEDAGKMIHGEGVERQSYVDLNRAGVPLIEIVSRPDLASPEEAYEYLREIKNIMEYIAISDCNMQEGNLRCDANISVRPPGLSQMGTKVEIKNLNSINYMRRALEFESQRQWAVIQQGGVIAQATYTWVEAENRTELMRSKEYAHDYRYFPDPDLGPFSIERAWVEELGRSLPELPRPRMQRLVAQYGLHAQDAHLLAQNRYTADYFEACTRLCQEPQEVANWIKGRIYTCLNEKKMNIQNFPVAPENLAALIRLLQKGQINRSGARDVFEEMLATSKTALQLAAGKRTLSDHDDLQIICRRIVQDNQKLAADYCKNPNVLNSFVGKVMRETQGRADVQQVREILCNILGVKA